MLRNKKENKEKKLGGFFFSSFRSLSGNFAFGCTLSYDTEFRRRSVRSTRKGKVAFAAFPNAYA